MNPLGFIVVSVTLILFWVASKLSAKKSLRDSEKGSTRQQSPARAKAKAHRVAKKNNAAADALDATENTFIVADLETTGLNRVDDDIIEIAAARVSPNGRIIAEFSTLIRIKGRIPPKITDLTGITNKDCLEKGKPLVVAMHEFSTFAGKAPVFFHNASFDKSFLASAGDRTGIFMKNEVFDTLAIARAVWPELPTHKLSALAKWLGLSAPSHRALADVRATVGVLMAAKNTAIGKLRKVAPSQGQLSLDFTVTALADA